MLRHRHLALALLFGALSGTVTSCGELKESCGAAEVLFSCGAELDEEGFDQGVKGCQQVHKDAKALSDACAEAHLAFLECFDAEADCNDVEDWRQDKCGARPETVCAAQAAAFCARCSGLWFAPD